MTDLGQSKFNCPHCPLTYLTYQSLANHRKSLHASECKNKCQFCYKLFLKKDTLQLHIKERHTDKTFVCHFPSPEVIGPCLKRFRTRGAVIAHFVRNHKFERTPKITSQIWKKWIKLEEVDEVILKKKEEPGGANEIMNILTKDDDDDIPGSNQIFSEDQKPIEAPQDQLFEIIERKFTEDLDYEICIQKPKSLPDQASSDSSSDESISLLSDKKPPIDKLLLPFESPKKEPSNPSNGSPVKSIRSTKSNRRIQPRRSCSKTLNLIDEEFKPVTSKKAKTKTVKSEGRVRDRRKSVPGIYKCRGVEYQLTIIDGVEEYHCPLCDKVCHSESSFSYHIMIHNSISTGSSFHCTQCNITFNNELSLKKHLQLTLAHGFKRRFKCPDCPKSFTKDISLKRHYGVHHEGTRHHCLICRVSYGRVDVLAAHLKSENHKRLEEIWKNK